MKERVNLISIFRFIITSIIVGILGVGLPDTINFINGFEESAFYGYFASYSAIAILFWLLVYDMKITTKRESYFILLERFIKKYLIIKQLKHSNKNKEVKGKNS